MSAVETEERAARAAARGGAGKRTYVRRMFSEIAPRYDFLNHLLSLNIDRGWRRRAVDRLAWERRPTGVYLDACAGTLDLSVELAARRAFRGTVLAADFAEPMLRRGREKVAGRAIVPAVADALELPVRDGALSGAMVAFGIRNLEDLDGGLRELRRVLDGGARLVILECSRPPSRAVRAVYDAYFHRVLPAVGRVVSGHPTAYGYLPESVSHFPTGDELASRMRAAGFGDVTWEPLTMGVAAIHVGRAA
ncbi:MAG TPA: ubiquinone/menaquinone biosynthesis methyltransferase [Gemmatimonadaceae bacterium]|nr:ubiquinone/menaquinone biosynthesis methyltransferase [Gemmatimonadaceae bacterium]